MSDKTASANCADPDKTAPEGSGSTLFAISLSILLRNNCTKSKHYAKKVWNKVFKI